jgi:hypothetical protein
MIPADIRLFSCKDLFITIQSDGRIVSGGEFATQDASRAWDCWNCRTSVSGNQRGAARFGRGGNDGPKTYLEHGHALVRKVQTSATEGPSFTWLMIRLHGHGPQFCHTATKHNGGVLLRHGGRSGRFRDIP